MLYDGVLDLIDSATASGLPVSIATNGTRVASAASRLVEAPLFLLQVSIDGPTEELHNSIRVGAGTANNFADIVAGLGAVNEARRSQKSDLPLIASLTTISRANVDHLVDIYEAFGRQVDMCVFYLSWWIDSDSAEAHERDFSRRFGFVPSLHRGWIGNWKTQDYAALDRQIKTLQTMSRPLKAPPVIVIPNISGAENLRTYYTDHSCCFGFDRCLSVYHAAEVDSNGDISPCRDYHDYVVGNIKESTLTDLWNSPAYLRFRRSISTDGLMPVCSRCCGLMGY
jgi:radical SAM protein with 4Fe4S-binding SPASM domain